MSHFLKSIKDIEVILASTASWRGAVLDQLGIPHRRVSHQYEEPRFADGSLVDFVKETSRMKALSIKEDFPGAMVVSADQLICQGDTVFHKPETIENAVNQLLALSGKTHQIICALTVLYGDKEFVTHDEAILKTRELTRREIENYVRKDESWGCAGAYKIESLGASLFETISVTDPTTIIGIPGTKLIDIIRSLGFSNLI